MVPERYANDFTTTLADVGGIDSTQTTLTLTSSTGAPLAPFRLRIDTELMIVGSRSGTSCSNITRGVEGTAQASHDQGTTVEHVLSRAGLYLSGGFYDARAFDVAGDGVTNDTAALQAAIDAASNNGVLYIPPGDYLTDAPLIVASHNVTIIGAGRRMSSINGTHAGPIIDTPDSEVNDPVYAFFNMRHLGLNTSSSSASAMGLRLREYADCTFEDIRFGGEQTGAGSAHVQMYRNILITFRDCEFESFGPADWSVRQGLGVHYNNVMRYEACSFKSSKGGIEIIAGASANLFANHFEIITGTNGGGFSGVYWDCYDGGKVDGNYFESMECSAITVGGSCGPVQGLDIGGTYMNNFASPGMDLRLLRNSFVGTSVFNPSSHPNSDGIWVNDPTAKGLVIMPQYLRPDGSGSAVVDTGNGGVVNLHEYGPFSHAGVPTNGVTFAGVAGKGAMVIDFTNGNWYKNTGTKASPTWTQVS